MNLDISPVNVFYDATFAGLNNAVYDNTDDHFKVSVTDKIINITYEPSIFTHYITHTHTHTVLKVHYLPL